MSDIKIFIGYCNCCGGNFEYIPGHINSVTSRNVDTYGCPRCPGCGSITTTHQVGEKITLVYSVKKERF